MKLCNDSSENYEMLINHAVIGRDHNSALKRDSKVNQHFETAFSEGYFLCSIFLFTRYI